MVVSCAVLLAAILGLVVFLRGSAFASAAGETDACTTGTEHVVAAEESMHSAFDGWEVAGASWQCMLGTVLCGLSFLPPMLLYRYKQNAGAWDMATLLHAVLTLLPLVCFAYALSVLDTLNVSSVRNVLLSFRSSCSSWAMPVYDFLTTYVVCQLALYLLVLAVVLGHTMIKQHRPDVVPQKRWYPWWCVPTCSCVAALLFLYTYSQARKECTGVDDGTAAVMHMLQWRLLWSVLFCVATCVLGIVAANARHQLRKNEQQHTQRPWYTLQFCTTTNIIVAQVVVVHAASVAHSMFVYDWALAANAVAGTADTGTQCVPNFATTEKAACVCGIVLYLLTIVLPHVRRHEQEYDKVTPN